MVNGEEDSFWKWPNFQHWRARDIDLGSGHTAYGRASLVDLYIHTKFHWNRGNFLCTDRRTYVRMDRWTDRQTFETGCIRSTLSKSRVDLKTWNRNWLLKNDVTLTRRLPQFVNTTFYASALLGYVLQPDICCCHTRKA